MLTLEICLPLIVLIVAALTWIIRDVLGKDTYKGDLNVKKAYDKRKV